MAVHSDTHILDFLVAYCEMASPHSCVRANRLYDAYLAYATENGISKNEVLGRTAFGVRMGQLFRRRNWSSGRFYMGICLK